MLKFIFTATALSCALCAKPQTTMFRGSPAHEGVYPGSYNAFGDVKWKYKTNGKVISSPAISNGTVFCGSDDHNLYAINEKTGGLAWKFATGGAIASSPAVRNSIVYFSSFDGYDYAVRANTGKLLWKFKTGGEKRVGSKSLWGMKPKDMYMDDPFDFFLSSPVTDDKDPLVYFGSSDGNLYALDANTGKQRWSFKTNGIIHSSPALYNGKVYFGSWDTYLYALDAHTGKLAWKFQTRNQPVYHQLEGIQSSPACADRMIYFGCRDGFFYALDATTGKQAWKYDATGSWVLTTPAVKDGTVYLGTSDTFLFVALDAKTGKEKFRYKTHGYIYSSPAVVNNTVFFGDFTGNLFAIDTRSGKLSGLFATPGRTANAGKVLSKKGDIDFNYLAGGRDLSLYQTTIYGMNRLYTLGSIVSSPVVSGDAIYFGSADGYIYCLNLKKPRYKPQK